MNAYLNIERDCFDDSREITAIVMTETFADGAKSAKRAIEDALDSGNFYPETVVGSLPGNQWLLTSGHAIKNGWNRGATRSEIQSRAREILSNEDAVFEMMANTLELCTKGSFSIVSESGKTSTFVEVEGDDIALVIEVYQYGFRIASLWNFELEDRRYRLQKNNDYLFIHKDGTVSRKLSGRVLSA